MGNLEYQHKDFEHVVLLISEARNRAYVKANEELIMLYYNVGKIVSEKVAEGNWGDSTVQSLADFIASKQPNLSGFNRRGLYRMKQFYETYSDSEFVSAISDFLQKSDNQMLKTVSTLSTQSNSKNDLSYQFVSTMLTQIQWSSHLHILSKTNKIDEHIFYIITAITQKLTVRELERQINLATFERTMISNKIAENTPFQLPQNLFKDPYIFEFLDLPDDYSEKEFEKAIVLNLQKFVLEVGKGFTYMGNQFRLQVGNKDYYTDLLFYHRDLQCLVLFELKIQEFEPEFMGKLNFYLEALDRDVKRPNENQSIGILLCKGKDSEVVEYSMTRNTSPAIIADYETKLINKNLLTRKLHQLWELFQKKQEEN